MTTRELRAAPILDRIITINRVVTRTVSGSVTYRFADDFGSNPGAWRVRGALWTIYVPDSDGVEPALSVFTDLVGQEITISDADGTTVTTVLNRAEVLEDRFGHPVEGVYELRTDDNPGGFSGELTIAIPGMDREVTESMQTTVWANRRDPTGRETLEFSDSSIVNVAVRFYTVRFEDGGELAAGQTFTDEQGQERTIVNTPAETVHGRNRYVELLGQAIT